MILQMKAVESIHDFEEALLLLAEVAEQLSDAPPLIALNARPCGGKQGPRNPGVEDVLEAIERRLRELRQGLACHRKALLRASVR